MVKVQIMNSRGVTHCPTYGQNYLETYTVGFCLRCHDTRRAGDSRIVQPTDKTIWKLTPLAFVCGVKAQIMYCPTYGQNYLETYTFGFCLRCHDKGGFPAVPRM